MDTRYADAIVALEGALQSAISKAERSGLTVKEIAKELRRLADELDPKSKSA